MRHKKTFVAVFLILLSAAVILLTGLYVKKSGSAESSKAEADSRLEDGSGDQLSVVTSFYPMYIAAMNLTDGDDHIALSNLSEPQTGCLHDYQLTPEDMELLSEADVFIVNGGGIESFLSDVADAYPDLVILDTGKEIDPIGDNSHFWMSIPRYRQQVLAIRDGLSEELSKRGASEEELSDLTENYEAYDRALDALCREEAVIRASCGGRSVILFHEAYEYLADDLGLSEAYLMDLDEERQISAGEISDVESLIQSGSVHLIFAEALYGSEMGEMIRSETGADVLYLDPLVRSDPAGDGAGAAYDKNAYLDRMQSNLTMIADAFGVDLSGTGNTDVSE